MNKSRLSWYKQKRLIELFVARTTARKAAKLAVVHRNTAALYFHRLRQLIYEHCDDAGLLEGETEADES
jgi:transposase